MLQEFRKFKGYLQKELCPHYLKEIGGINNIPTFITYKLICSGAYPHPDQPKKERFRKFAEFIKITSVSDGDLGGKPLPASKICTVAQTWINMMRNPVYYLWLVQKFTELNAKGINLSCGEY